MSVVPTPGLVTTDTYLPDVLIAGDMTRDTKTVTIASGQNLVRGSVLGMITEGAVTATPGTNTGNGTFGTITRGAPFHLGNYTVTMTGATTFHVRDPNGAELPDGNTGVAYNDPQIGFTLTAGGTPFVAGDSFTLAAAAGSAKYVLATSAAVDGSQIPVAILVDDCNATGGDQTAGIYQTGEFNTRAMTFGAGGGDAGAEPQLRAVGIFLKTSLSATPV